ncbi:hypothetical protein B9Z65_9033 [Elsinoe australis]|uniref:Rhodopsin domain-containing protein n=1 Tax=Elsinoe australis TaxID=40998 RepID=A0A2P8ABK7_9PEZI|nr:hypothetical protein B9Z65_9033 [Elsinoe australis]
MASPTAQAAPPAFTFPGSLYNGVSSYGGEGPEVLAVSWFFCALTLIVIGLRTYTTVFIIRRPRIDLWIMLVALVLACISQGFTHRAVMHGIGQTIGRVAIPDAFKANLNVIISVCIGQISLIIGKWGTALLILQIQGQTLPRLKWILYVALTLNTVIGLIASILMWLGCNHIPDQWQTNPITNPSCPRFRVSNNLSFTYWAVSATTDIILSVYPALIFLPLNMSLKRRLGLCVLFSGGVVAAAFAILRIVRTLSIGRGSFIADFTAESADTVRWSILEIWLVLLLTNIPPLRPCFTRVHTQLSSEDSPLVRLSKYVRKSTRSRSSGSDTNGKNSGPTDIEAQRNAPKSQQRLLTVGPMTKFSLHMPTLFSNTRTTTTTTRSARNRDTQAWSKFSFGFGATQSDTMTSNHTRSQSDNSTKVGSDDYGHHLEKEKDSYDGNSPASADSWLADNSDGESMLVPPRSKFSVARPDPARLALAPAPQRRQGQVEMTHHPGAGMIAVESEFGVHDSPRRSEAPLVGSKVEVQVSCPERGRARPW